MLTLTENASTIVKDIATQPGLPETAGLRITSDSAAEATFAVSAVEQAGATIYLDESAAALLDDKVLDAAVDPSGNVEFALGPQA